MKLNKPTSNTSKIKISIQYHLIDFLYFIKHANTSNCHSCSPQPHFYHLRILKPTYNLIKLYPVPCLFPVQPLLSSSTLAILYPSINFWLRINTDRVINMEARGTTSARMQHTFTPVCIVKPVFSLVTGHASLL